jgi:enoyl-CoA hydratase/carnithine racemase
MALGGQMFEAQEALRLGLIDEAVAPGQALARATAIARDVAARGPVAAQIVKSMINAAEGEDADAPIEALAGALTATTEDLAEGVAAFRARRPPLFQGR